MKLAIVFDGANWHVRRIRVIEYDLNKDEKVYRCDQPISNDHLTGHAALESALSALSAANS